MEAGEDRREVGESEPGVSLDAELIQHRQILQGMAVHLQSLEGRLYELSSRVEELVEWLASLSSEEVPSEAGSSPVPETDRSE
jgi:hypothetical protein